MSSNTHAPKLSKDVINLIKYFPYSYNFYDNLTEKQKSSIDELIPNEELRERYKEYGLCKECSQPNTSDYWCQSCNSKRFQQDFNKWTSGNKEIDGFIQKFQLNATRREEVLEWIPYEKFRRVKYLAKGGFGTVHKAEWIDGYIENWNINQNKWDRYGRTKIVLKCLNNSQNLTTDFLQEITLHKKIIGVDIVDCFGISQDTKTENFMMVMQYIGKNVSQYLKSNYNELDLYDKLCLFLNIARGLGEIHNKGFIHKDLHPGNILSSGRYVSYITDLGLCKPVNKQDEKKIHGVLPYVAPEVLRGKTYSQSTDIYSFGILACEVLSGLQPYHNLPHDEFLALKVCQGLRPKFNNVKVPLLLENLIDQCLDADPLNRPTAEQLFSIIEQFRSDTLNHDTEFYKQYKEAEEFNESTTSKLNASLNISSPSYTTHPQAIYTSRLLDYKNLPEPQNSKEINNKFYNSSDSLASLLINL